MRERKEVNRIQIYNFGPYTLAALSKICKTMFKEEEEKWKEGSNTILSEYELFIDTTYEYYESYTEFYMILYRMESDEEVKKREAALERKKLANLKLAEAIKVKKAGIEKDPEYIKYKELQKKFKGK